MTADKLNKADPGIWIELGGEKRKIVFSMHSLKQTEKLLGKNLLNQEIDTGEIDELVALLWAALFNGKSGIRRNDRSGRETGRQGSSGT